MTNINELNAPPKIQSLSECIFLPDYVLLIRNISYANIFYREIESENDECTGF